jgi:CBS domain-containing protein
MNKTVAAILEDKGREVWSLSSDASVFDALGLMAERNIGAVVVVDGDRLVGIISERDYARKVVLLDRVSKSTAIADIMTANVVTVTPEATVDHCMTLMTDRRIRHLPVIDDDRLLGVVSIGDVVRAVIAEREYLIAQLEQYIQG